MPRKTRETMWDVSNHPGGFNEAAARCRGKRATGRLVADAQAQASMRPRPDAAENGSDLIRRHGEACVASMRPRPDAAENVPCSASRSRAVRLQ